MGTVFMPFLMSMLLGRTIDLTTYTAGPGIYDDALYDETAIPAYNSTYTVLQDNVFPYNFMGLPVDIVLRIKSNMLSSSSGGMGLDGLLKETAWKQRSAVIAVASSALTVKRTLKKDAQLVSNWTSRIPDTQTHFANSIYYGGWAFILYRFKCDIPGDVDIVRDTLTSSLGIHGELGTDTIDLWKKATTAIDKNPEIRGKVTIHTHTYSTFPFKHNLKSLDELLGALDNIPEKVGTVGKPIFMELLPLHDIDENFSAVEENHELDKELEQIDEMFDDVKNTKDSLTRWVQETSKTFTDEEEETISILWNQLTACMKLFHEVASEASVYKNMNPKLLKSALLSYNQNLERYTDTYDRIFRRLKEEIDAECEDSFLHKIKGLLQVDDNERIKVGRVNGGLEECKSACLTVPNCRSIGYVDKMMTMKKDTTSVPPIIKIISKTKQCYVYFRSSSTANVVSPKAASTTGVYDRKCF